MALSIRNTNAETLARKIAAIEGESLTQAIIHALEERLERLEGRRKSVSVFEDILAISNRMHALPTLDPRNPDDILGYNHEGI